MCLDWVPGRVNEVLQAKPGRQLPIHAGAEGRAILSGLEGAELQSVLALAPFEAFTSATMITGEELLGDIARTRRQGFTVSLDDTLPGIGSIGVLVKDSLRGQLGSIAVSSLSEEILRRSDELGRILVEAAENHAKLTVDTDNE